jgi:hypothetical protein
MEYILPIYDETHERKSYVKNFIKRHRDRMGNGMYSNGSYVRRALKKKYNATYPDVHARNFDYKRENLNLMFESENDRIMFLLKYS